MRLWAILVPILIASTSASAGARFEGFEGPAVIRIGEGGSRLTKNGIDYWTNGSPARHFRVIGFVTDKRKSGPFHGDAVGSPSIAKLVKDNGGDAVILVDSEEKVNGVATSGSAYGAGHYAFGSAFSAAIVDRVSRMTVIKYLDTPNSQPEPLTTK